MDLQLAGKTALVTGGSRGIGRAVARALAQEGVDVALVARGREALEAAATELASATGRTVAAFAGDTGDDASVRQVVAAAAARLRGLDILVNCAAPTGGAAPPLAELRDEQVWTDLNVKVLGYLRCARAAAPYMTERGWGRIVNLGGLAARGAGAMSTSVRNVAVVALTKNLAEELSPRGINVTAVHPGPTRTEATPADAAARMAHLTSVRRAIAADDVAAVVAFLCSPRAVAINGDVIAAGGGLGPAIYY
jgi:NAD(P)-dependent dehydrogenase (short-subunit alcohol dehydrogenase family)